MKQKNIVIPKTARYFILGDPSPATRNVWFVCHGYGQLASYFLEHFRILEDAETVVVAPEGLHRFYWEKFSGRVVASWMTKEERAGDILDYTGFLDTVAEEVLAGTGAGVNIHVLGFSQGAATASRWLASGNVRAQRLVLWAGGFPDDISDISWLAKTRLILVTGDQDPFISEEKINSEEARLRGMNVSFEHLRFSGKHEIDQDILRTIAAQR